MFMSGGSSVAASNAATIMSNSIVNVSSIAAHIGFADAADAVAGQSARAASASKQVTQLRNAVDVGGGHVGFPNRSVSSCKNALLAAVRYAPLRSKTAAVRVGRGGSSGTGCRPSCTRAM